MTVTCESIFSDMDLPGWTHCHGFTPASNQAPGAAHCSPTSRIRERIRKIKARKPVGWDRDNLVRKAKANHTSKVKPRINSLFPIGSQVFSHLQESTAPSHMMVTWENKHHHSKCPPFLPSSFFLPFCILSMMSYGWEYPFVQFGSPVPLWIKSTLLKPSHPTDSVLNKMKAREIL